MLAQYYELWAVNNLGTDIDASSNSGSEHLHVRLEPYKFTSGALAYISEVSRDLAVDLADGGASVLGLLVDNSGDLALGFNGRMEISSDDTAHDGTVDLYLIEATDGSGTVFPSDHANFNVEEDGIFIASLTFDHDGSGTDVKGVNFEYD